MSHERGKSAPDRFQETAEDDSKTGVGPISKAPAAKRPKASAHELTEDELNMATGGTATITPRDPASGLPTGKRMHKPFTVP